MNRTRGILGGILATSLSLALVAKVSAQTTIPVSDWVIQDTIKQLEIMVGDSKGNMNLENTVTRAEFATMLVAASPLKNVTTSFGYTLFPDVPATHWASGYVKMVVEQGYMVGQLDGKFSPSRPVLLEEAVTAVLCLLGYDGSTLSGTYPQAQLAKYYELDLDDYMTATAGTSLTREDCMYLFFNLMNTSTIDGTPYASKLGYSITQNGDIDTIQLTNSNVQGPYIVGNATLPTTLENVDIIYKNDKAASVSSLAHYDICYYNEKLNTMWIYDEKITGRITAIDNFYAPTQVTVLGKTYELETTNVRYKFTVGGDFEEGSMVTLMLGQYGKVADAVEASVTDSTLIGYVLDNGVGEFADSNDSSSVSRFVKVVTSAGDIIEVESSGVYQAGRLVQISYTGGVQTVKSISDKSVEGVVNSTATRLGSYNLADDLEIIEIIDGNVSTVHRERLAGASLKDEDVRYYTTNKNGEIDRMILENVTGDAAEYVFISSVVVYQNPMFFDTKLYNYYTNGQFVSYLAETRDLRGTSGASYFKYDDSGNPHSFTSLTKMELTSITAFHGNEQGKSIPLAENVLVYEKYRDTYVLRTLSAVNDLDKYDLTAYYDEDIFSAGGYIRLIIAESK